MLIIGCGDISERVARLERSKDRFVDGLARPEKSAQRLRVAGIHLVTGDLDIAASLNNFPMEDACRRLGEGMLSYLAEFKCIDNRRMRKELRVELMHPGLVVSPASCFEGCG